MLFADSQVSSNALVDLTFSDKSQPLVVYISPEHSRAYGWKAGQKISISAQVERNGQKEKLRDAQGKDSWELVLNAFNEATGQIYFDRNVFSGALEILANGEMLPEQPSNSGIPAGRLIEKVREYQFDDGAKIKVHFTDQALKQAGAPDDFTADVLSAAVTAYQTITEFEGFRSTGYAFASADKNFAYDPDRTIDIYLGSAAGANGFEKLGTKNQLFKDAPCFDTIKTGPSQYEAVILLPANYHEFIRNWEKINPSPLGKRNIEVDLRGTLIHEMLHVIIFYYNKNLNKATDNDSAEVGVDVSGGRSKHLDWYVEGLARYFETLAGARHDFYSQGFKQMLPDKIRFSRGGSNYFMRYPDQAFINLRYENALFWRFIHYRFGMEAIESMSRNFRGHHDDFKKILERATGERFELILKQFASAVLFSDFGLKEDSRYLNEIAKTRLTLRQDGFYLFDGSGHKKYLGRKAATDWIGQWADAKADFGQPSVAGDSTEEADVSGWATDFVQMNFESSQKQIHGLGIRHVGAGPPLHVQVFLYTRGGSILENTDILVPGGSGESLGLEQLLKKNNLNFEDMDKAVILITNTDPENPVFYEFFIEE